MALKSLQDASVGRQSSWLERTFDACMSSVLTKILLMQLWAVSQTEDKAEHKVCATGQTVKPLFTRTLFSPRYCTDARIFVIFVVLSLQY